MAITSWDHAVAAVAGSQKFALSKASVANTTAGGITSLLRASGVPVVAAIPGVWANPTKSDAAYPSFADASGAASPYLVGVDVQMATAGTVIWFDRLGHMGGLNGTLNTAQTVNGAIPANRGAAVDGSDVEWWLEWYTDTGSTGVNATVTYTNQADASGRTCVVALAATMRAGRMLPIIPTTAGDLIKSVQSVTLSATTGTAGSFGVTLTRRLAASSVAITNQISMQDAVQMKFPALTNSSAVFPAVLCSTTSTGLIQGTISIGSA